MAFSYIAASLIIVVIFFAISFWLFKLSLASSIGIAFSGLLGGLIGERLKKGKQKKGSIAE